MAELELYGNIPLEMQQAKRWILWKLEGKEKKPKLLKGDAKGYQKPENWETFEVVVEAVKNFPRLYTGIGFYLGDGFACLDFDYCVENGHVDGEVRAIIDSIDTYVEKSQSGNGIHVFGKCEKYRSTLTANNSTGCEIYAEQNHFIAMTGDTYNNIEDLANVDDLFLDLDRKYRKKQINSSVGNSLPLIVPDGQRDDFMTSMTGKLYWLIGDQRDVVSAMACALNNQVCIPPKTPDEMSRIVGSVRRYHKDSRGLTLDYSSSQVEEKVYSLEEMMNMDIKPVEWLVKGLIPTTGFNLLVADHKIGKSWMALQLMSCLSAGLDFMGMPTRETKCLYLSLDNDSMEKFVGRVRKQGIKGIKPGNINYLSSFPNLADGGAEKLKEYLADNPDVGLVVIDVWQYFKGIPTNKNGNAYEQDYELMKHFFNTMKGVNTAFLVLHHENGQGGISGSKGVPGAANQIFRLKRVGTQGMGVLHVTGRDIQEKELSVRLNIEGNLTWVCEGTTKQAYVRDARKEIKDLLSSEGKPMSIKRISDTLDREYSSVRKLLQRMHMDNEIDKDANGLYYLYRQPVQLEIEQDNPFG